MLQVLNDAMKALPGLFDDDKSPWNTLAVRYETPHVNRIWIQWGEYRINLHMIFPCDEALWHPHPWPSAVKILSGQYEMGVASYNDGAMFNVAKVVLREGSSYEMVNPLGWHYVKPIGEPSMSVMVTGKPWETTHSHPGKGLEHRRLTGKECFDLLRYFEAQSRSWII